MSELTHAEKLEAAYARTDRLLALDRSTPEGQAEEQDIHRQIDEAYAYGEIPTLDGSNRDKVLKAVAKDIRTRRCTYALNDGTLAQGPCDHASLSPDGVAIFWNWERIQLDRLQAIEFAAQNLDAFVRERYGITSADQYSCPKMRALHHALAVSRG